MSETIKFEVIGGVGKITLNRPDKYNSFNREMALEMQKRLDQCESSKEIRVILITGEGKAFCAGQDLAEAIDENNGIDISKIVEEHYNPIILKIRKIKFMCVFINFLKNKMILIRVSKTTHTTHDSKNIVVDGVDVISSIKIGSRLKLSSVNS